MSTGKTGTQYDEDFKRTLVNLYQSGGKTHAALCKEYGVLIIPELSEPPVRTLGATIPENESHIFR